MSGVRVIMAVGEGANPNGELTERSMAVAERAAELLRDGKGDFVLFSGKVGARFVGSHPSTEAALMGDYAMSKGASREKILLEEESMDTLSNAIFCRPIVDRLGARDLILVAGEWHMLRSAYIYNMVFGPSYKITPVTARDTFTQDQLDRVLPAEMVSLWMTMSIFREFGVEPGDAKRAEEAMRASYDSFNRGNKDFKESGLRVMMRRELNRQRNKQPIVDQKY